MSSVDPHRDYIQDYIDAWNGKVRHAKIWMVVLGIALVVAGVAAALSPFSLYALIQSFAAAALIIHGATQVVGYFQTPEFFRNGTMMASGVLNALIGVLLVALPSLFTASALVFMLALVLIVSGIERVTFARQLRYYRIPASSAGAVTGAINIILGALFLLMPLMTSFALVYLIAGYLIVAGVTLIIESISIKRIER